MFRIFFVALALLLGAGPDVEAQVRPAQRQERDRGPIQMLLEARSELQLSRRQVSRLEQIDAEMDRLNQPLVTQMSAIRGKIRELGPVEKLSPEQRARYDSYLAVARPVMERIQENNWNAMRQVGEILSPEQKEWVAQQLRQQNDSTRERNSRFPRLPGRGD